MDTVVQVLQKVQRLGVEDFLPIRPHQRPGPYPISKEVEGCDIVQASRKLGGSLNPNGRSDLVVVRQLNSV